VSGNFWYPNIWGISRYIKCWSAIHRYWSFSNLKHLAQFKDKECRPMHCSFLNCPSTWLHRTIWIYARFDGKLHKSDIIRHNIFAYFKTFQYPRMFTIHHIGMKQRKFKYDDYNSQPKANWLFNCSLSTVFFAYSHTNVLKRALL